MLSTFGAAFLELLTALRRSEVLIARRYGGDSPEEIKPLEEFERPESDLRLWLRATEYHCRCLGILSIQADTERLRGILDSEPEREQALKSGELQFRVKQLREHVQDGFKGQQFYFVTPPKAELFDKPDLFGSKVQEKFGETAFHIVEAGSCIALERHTAAVFHLMCVLEFGIGSLASTLQIPSPKDNWGALLNQIGDAIQALGPKDGPTWKEDRAFYSQAAQEFRFFKDAWRNYVAHGKSTYTEEQALAIFEHVKTFMQQLSEGLR